MRRPEELALFHVSVDSLKCSSIIAGAILPVLGDSWRPPG
jgi:hypothetical protein